MKGDPEALWRWATWIAIIGLAALAMNIAICTL